MTARPPLSRIRPYTAVIFDFDFTLADAGSGILASFRHAFERMSLPCPDDYAILRTVGMALDDAFPLLTGISDPDAVRQLRAHFREKADEVMAASTVFFPGALELLTELRARSLKTAVVSSKYRYRIEEVFALHGASGAVDLIVGYEDTDAHKPKPDGLLIAAERLGVRVEGSLYVGDSVVDGQTAQNAGMDFAATLTGPTGREEFEGIPYVCITESLSGVMQCLGLV